MKCVHVTLAATPESPQFSLAYCPERFAYNCREHGRDWRHTYCTVGMLDCPFDKPCISVSEQDWDAIMEKETNDEFYSRVAVKLARYAAILSSDIGCDDCPAHKACTRFENKNISCEDVFLKAACLAVEKEI